MCYSTGPSSTMNVVVALTNGFASFPLIVAGVMQWTTLAPLVLLAGFASFIYHLFESHKHDMAGFGSSHKLSKTLLNFDRVSALALVAALAPMFLEVASPEVLFAAFQILMLMLFSELPGMPRSAYIVLHCCWHATAFVFCGIVMLLWLKENPTQNVEVLELSLPGFFEKTLY